MSDEKSEIREAVGKGEVAKDISVTDLKGAPPENALEAVKGAVDAAGGDGGKITITKQSEEKP